VAPLPAQPAEAANILFIYTDDHSYRTVGACRSLPWVRTRISTGWRNRACGSNRLTSAPGACLPATLLTGHLQFGVESMRMEGPYPGSVYDPEKCPFWPKIFRQNGYVTAQIGKWHTGVDTGYGRDWDFQLVWNRPKYTETNQNYYYDQPVTHQGGETEILKRYSTDQYTDWAIDIPGKGQDTAKPPYLWLLWRGA
jgi:arylsulfatase A-like enzyme